MCILFMDCHPNHERLATPLERDWCVKPLILLIILRITNTLSLLRMTYWMRVEFKHYCIDNLWNSISTHRTITYPVGLKDVYSVMRLSRGWTFDKIMINYNKLTNNCALSINLYQKGDVTSKDRNFHLILPVLSNL